MSFTFAMKNADPRECDVKTLQSLFVGYHIVRNFLTRTTRAVQSETIQSIRSLKQAFTKLEPETDNSIISVDVHPTKQWFLITLARYELCVWDHENHILRTTIIIGKHSLTSGNFIEEGNWILCTPKLFS